MRILQYNNIKKILMVILAATYKDVNSVAANSSLLSMTTNDTHKVITTKHGDEIVTTVLTPTSTQHVLKDLKGQLLADSTIHHSNGSQSTTILNNDGGKITRHTQKNSSEITITYTDKNGHTYIKDTKYANDTIVRSFGNGTTIEDTDGVITRTDPNQTQVTYPNGTKIITTSEVIIMRQPDGTEITQFLKNGTIIEKDPDGGRIVRAGDNTIITYDSDSSTVNITDKTWDLLLGEEDEPPRDEL